MRVLITGGKGQLGTALASVYAGQEVWLADLPEVDITSPAIVQQFRQWAPDLVIHAAAMTNVDGAARDPALAYRINAWGTRLVAAAAYQAGSALVVVSTNEVFDGTATEPYHEWAATHPINPYGASKLAGEQEARSVHPGAIVARTAWVFGGASSFPTKMLDLAAQRSELSIVADEVSNPTYAPDLAAGIAALATAQVPGTYHLTNAGEVSRFDYAAAIFERAGVAPALTRIRLADYQRASTPPPYAPLANTAAAALGVTLRPWQDALDAWFASRPAGGVA